MRGELGFADEHRRATVAQDIGDSVGRILRIHRHVGGAGFHHGEHRHVHFHRAAQKDANDSAASDAGGADKPRELIGAPFDFRVGNLLASEFNRDAIGTSISLRLEQLVQELGTNQRQILA